MDGKAPDSAKLPRELCFVWGAPLSGQRRWMLRSAELSPADTQIDLHFNAPDCPLKRLIANTEASLQKSLADTSHKPHVYVELPSQLLLEDIELNSWIEKIESKWNVSFAGVISEEAHALNPYYKELYEEFARSSQSVIVLARSQRHRHELPAWIQNQELNFGRHVQVFEDDLWPKAVIEEDPSAHKIHQLKEFSDEYDEIEFAIASHDTQKIELLFKQLIGLDGGVLWGAELIGPNQAFTLNLSQLVVWPTHTRATIHGQSQNVSILSLAGVGIDRHQISQHLRHLQLLIDS